MTFIDMPEELPVSLLERALMMQNILPAACEGDRSSNSVYYGLRLDLMNDPAVGSLIPQFVRTCRDLNHFWGHIKTVSPHWEPRRNHIRDALAPLLDHLEGRNRAPIDSVASDVLASFDCDGVHLVWSKALARRHTDPEGAITTARTLLETVCKRVLDQSQISYKEALHLNIAPS